MIADIWLRLLVTGLFLLSAAQCVYAITVREDRSRADQVSRVLHLLMAVAMLVMAWPAGMSVPNRPPMVFFLLATGWFAVLLLTRAGHRVADGLGMSVDDVKHLPPLQSQTLSEAELERLKNLGNNGPRNVEGLVMTHAVPNERDVLAEEPAGVS